MGLFRVLVKEKGRAGFLGIEGETAGSVVFRESINLVRVAEVRRGSMMISGRAAVSVRVSG